MEQKHILGSALGVGLGLASGDTLSKWTGSSSGSSSGLGLGLGSGSGSGSGSVSNAVTADKMEQEMLREVVDGREGSVTFEGFPFYLSKQTRALLMTAAYVHLKQAEFYKHTRNLSPASRIILLSGPAELYQQMIAKALAHYFDAKLLLLDATYFLLKVLVSVSKSSPIVLYLRDVEKLLSSSQRMYNLIQKMLSKLSGPIPILGSHILDLENDNRDMDERLSSLFPYNIEIRPPQDETDLVSWNTRLEEDVKMIQFQDNKDHIKEVPVENDIDCHDLDSICMADTVVLCNYVEEIGVSAISYHWMNNKNPEYRHGRLIISSQSLSHGLSLFQESKSGAKNTSKLEEILREAPGSKSEALLLVPAAKKDGDSPLPASKAPVAASFSSEGYIMSELKQRNDLYGEGGSRKKEQLSYFFRNPVK